MWRANYEGEKAAEMVFQMAAYFSGGGSVLFWEMRHMGRTRGLLRAKALWMFETESSWTGRSPRKNWRRLLSFNFLR